MKVSCVPSVFLGHHASTRFVTRHQAKGKQNQNKPHNSKVIYKYQKRKRIQKSLTAKRTRDRNKRQRPV